jgi:hypothetical protein
MLFVLLVFFVAKYILDEADISKSRAFSAIFPRFLWFSADLCQVTTSATAFPTVEFRGETASCRILSYFVRRKRFSSRQSQRTMRDAPVTADSGGR